VFHFERWSPDIAAPGKRVEEHMREHVPVPNVAHAPATMRKTDLAAPEPRTQAGRPTRPCLLRAPVAGGRWWPPNDESYSHK